MCPVVVVVVVVTLWNAATAGFAKGHYHPLVSVHFRRPTRVAAYFLLRYGKGNDQFAVKTFVLLSATPVVSVVAIVTLADLS